MGVSGTCKGVVIGGNVGVGVDAEGQLKGGGQEGVGVAVAVGA